MSLLGTKRKVWMIILPQLEESYWNYRYKKGNIKDKETQIRDGKSSKGWNYLKYNLTIKQLFLKLKVLEEI